MWLISQIHPFIRSNYRFRLHKSLTTYGTKTILEKEYEIHWYYGKWGLALKIKLRGIDETGEKYVQVIKDKSRSYAIDNNDIPMIVWSNFVDSLEDRSLKFGTKSWFALEIDIYFLVVNIYVLGNSNIYCVDQNWFLKLNNVRISMKNIGLNI